MTLKELLTQVSFDELLPSLKKHEQDHLDDIYSFREAHDLLQDMEPDKDFKGEAHVEWSGGGGGSMKVNRNGLVCITWTTIPGKRNWPKKSSWPMMCICPLRNSPCIACGKSRIGDFPRRKSAEVGKNAWGTSDPSIPMKWLWTSWRKASGGIRLPGDCAAKDRMAKDAPA